MEQILFGEPEKNLESPFGKMFLKKMRLKGVKITEIKAILRNARSEIRNKIWKNVTFDSNDTNILILDFDPITKKPLIAIVDHGASEQT